LRLRSIAIIATVWISTTAAYAGHQASIIKEIVVKGNQRVTTQAILANMRTKVGQPFLQENLDHDKETLTDLGFFQSVDVRGTPLDNGNWQVSVDVVEFPVIKEIRITGNTVVKTEDILKVLTLKPGEVFNLKQADPSARAVEALYSKKGYFARVTDLSPLAQSPNTLNLAIVETRVGTVSVQGNVRTKEAVMRRLIKTRPGDVLSGAKVTADLKRLYNSQWFENPTPIDEPVDLGIENLTYVVKEAKTGQFSFGVQVDPASSIAGVVRVSDTNLGGTGQGLSLDLTQATQGGGPSVGLDYTNPFYDSKDTTIRASIYSRIVYRFSGVFGQTTSSLTSEYYERRTGTSLGFSRPINDTNSYGLGLRVENVNTQVNSSVSDFIQQDGDVAVGTLGYTINRRDVDSDPSRGDYLHLAVEPGYSDITEVGGVGANTSILGTNLFLRDTADYRHYWTNGPPRTAKEIDAPRKVLALRVRVGDIRGKVPFFEQFFAGGVDTIRGYDEDILWGRDEFITNLEYRVPIQKSFEFIPFVDYGGAWGGYGSINSYTQTQGALLYLGFGAGVSFKIPGLGNIRLDLGLDEQFRSRVHFQIGQPF
jgi:outer membrane protein insertion porin family